MRTSTILGISISLATGIILGWSFSNAAPDQKYKPKNTDSLFAYTPPVYTPPPAPEPMTPQPPPPKADISQLAHAEDLLKASRPHEALTALADISSSIDLSTTTGKEWLRLLVDAYASTDNTEQLLHIYRRFPSALSTNEQAALAVANALIVQQNTTDYHALRASLKGSQNPQWTFLDAQENIIDGKPAEAIALLQSAKFNGKDETERLVRLAALFVADEPKRAWNYLSEAAKLDPANPDVHTFRASLGEILDRSQTAHSDYIVAVQNDPENPYRREQLADFYLRSKQYPQAIKILQDTMTEPSLDTIWLKTLFWSRMATPVKRTWKGAPIPDGSTKEFVAYLNAIPEGVFWNEGAFNELPNKQQYLDTLQETFWLQLVADLKNGKEAEAQQLLSQNPFTQASWAPETESAIRTILNFRLTTPATTETLSLFPRSSDIDSPAEMTSLLASLANVPPEQLSVSIPLDLHDLLLSKEAFVVPFLAAGWNEAAIQLHGIKDFPNAFPSWLAVSFTKALNQNRDTDVALGFASAQKPSSALSLLIAELALANQDKQKAFEVLKGIYTTNDTNGRKAALMLGQFLMEHDNPQDAKKALLTHPALADDAAAKELLARIAVQEGDIEKAAELYSTLETQSSEAKSFLARKAYADKDWTRARKLTEALLLEFPENPTLQDNLKKIALEEKKQFTLKTTAATK